MTTSIEAKHLISRRTINTCEQSLEWEYAIKLLNQSYKSQNITIFVDEIYLLTIRWTDGQRKLIIDY